MSKEAENWLKTIPYRRTEILLVKKMLSVYNGSEAPGSLAEGKRIGLEQRLAVCEADIYALDAAMSLLEEDEKIIAEDLLISGKRGACMKLIDKYKLSKSAIYRLRRSAIKKMTKALIDLQK